MGTVVREIIVQNFAKSRWNPDVHALFRNTVLLSTPTPVLPPSYYDTTQWRPLAPRSAAVNFFSPNITVNLPPPGVGIDPRAPVFNNRMAGAPRNSSLYFDSPNITLTGQGSLGAAPLRPVDINTKPIAKRLLLVDYPPNLSLSILISNPYVPIDVSPPKRPPSRNSSLYFDAPNLAIRPIAQGTPPVRPIDTNLPGRRRQPIVFDAPNLAVSLSFGTAPYMPAEVGDPPARPKRAASLYDTQNLTLPLLGLGPVVFPTGSGADLNTSVISARYTLRSLSPGLLWFPEQPTTLFSKPVQTATIPNLNYRVNSGIQTYGAGTAFISAVSYAMAPAPDAGITFNTVTGLITTDTAVATAGTHGPYTITATNPNGSTVSNAFSIILGIGDYCVDGPRVTESTSALGVTYGVSGPRVTRDTPNSEDLS